LTVIDTLLNETETAPILRIKIKTLQSWRQLQKGPRYVRVGRRIFYPACEVERYLAQHLVETSDSREDASAEERVITKGARKSAA
jgi:hypothetical protein